MAVVGLEGKQLVDTLNHLLICECGVPVMVYHVKLGQYLLRGYVPVLAEHILALLYQALIYVFELRDVQHKEIKNKG